MAVDYTNIINERLQGVKQTYYGLLTLFSDFGMPAFLSQAIAGACAGLIAVGSILYVILILSFVSIGTTLVQLALDTLKSIRQDGAADFAAVTAEAMSEFMAVDTTEVDFAVGKDSASSLKRAEQLGGLFVDMMQTQFGKGGPQSPDDGETAAKALAGYGINFATSNTFLSWMVELGTDGKFGDFDKLGEDIAGAIGLGRLTRQALRPLVRNAISQPYDRKMRALYRADLIAAPELVKEFLAGRITEAQCDEWLSQHGYSDTFIAALKAQHTPSLHPAEIEELQALGAIDATTGRGQLKEQGIPDSIAGWHLQLLTWKRLSADRNRVLSEVLGQIKTGFLPALAMDDACSKLGIPQDETNLWKIAAGYAVETARKRPAQGEILYLYEAAQITLADVQAWLISEGYSQADQQTMLTYFELKAVEASHKTTGGAAARAAHLHKEHVAYVTDEITGLFGRAPTAAEVSYWVNLLDTAERTKHDFLTELKALDTKGSAIPTS